jgi:hypothetical protein
MMDQAEKRGQLIRHLEDLALSDEIQDGHTGYLIERALDEARSRHNWKRQPCRTRRKDIPGTRICCRSGTV